MQTVREIKELKRKSQMVFAQNGIDFSQIVDINLDEDPGETLLEDEVQESPHAKEYQAQIEVLKDELFNAKKDIGYAIDERDIAQENLAAAYSQIAQLKEQMKLENVSHEKTKKALQERDNIINQLKRVSTLVYNEFNEVQSLYEKESAMREQAEKMASEYYAKNKEAEAYKRQSAMLVSDAISGDDKLIQSMTEMEKLTKELEEEKERHRLEVKRLKDELELSESREKMEMLENKLSIAKEENESLEKRVDELDVKNKELAYELKEALSKPSLPNIPPPPPPPPVPQPPRNPLEMLQKIIKRKNHNKKSEDGRQLDCYQKQFETAMQDMITRIKKGQIVLKPVTKPEASEGRTSKGPVSKQSMKRAQAVQELDNILVGLKNRNRNRPRPLPKGSKETEQTDEFAKIMAQRKERSKQPPPTSARPSPQPTAHPRSTPRSLTCSTSLDSGILPHRTVTNVPPVIPKRSPLTTTTSDPTPPPPEPIYSTVHHDDSPPSTPSSTLSSIISSSSQEIEIQNNPAFIHDSGDERYASADFTPPPPTANPSALQQNGSKFTIASDFGESGDYSLVEERQDKPVPSPRRQPSIPKHEPEPYYSEVNNL
nr:shootin-1-like [Lytechinus pictus]